MLTFVQVYHYKPSQRRATTLSIVRSCQASERSATAVRFQQRVVVLSTNPWANPRFPLYESSCVPSEKNCFKGKNRRSTKHASKAKTDRRTTKNMVQRPKQTQHKGKHSGWLLRSSWQGRKQGDQDKVSATTMHTGLRPCVVTELSCRASHHDYVSQGGRRNAHFQTLVASRWKRSCEISSPPIVDDSSFVCFHWRAASLAALCCACRLLVTTSVLRRAQPSCSCRQARTWVVGSSIFILPCPRTLTPSPIAIPMRHQHLLSAVVPRRAQYHFHAPHASPWGILSELSSGLMKFPRQKEHGNVASGEW